MDACVEVDGRVWERRGNIYIKKWAAIQLLSVIMLHDLCVTVCVCSEGSALFHMNYYDVAVIQWLMSCRKNRMTTRYIRLGYWRVTS